MSSSVHEKASAPSPANGRQEAAVPVIGIGASAGGLQAFGQFFKALPPHPGMAFVLVQHLDPTHESELAALLQNSTAMEVHQAKDGDKVEPNHVYVIPPGTSLTLKEGTLYLSEPVQKRGRRAPIDLFFRSLAEDQGENAVCIILSGTGSDGTSGLKAVKERAGITMAQDPDEAEYDGMPRSAVETGLVDLVLPVSDLAKKLVAYKDTAAKIQLPLETEDLPEGDSEALLKIFSRLRAKTGHDFSNYKRSTILRRIGRRLQVNQIEDLPAYLRRLQKDSNEVKALFKDFLISVTNFFRDPEAFSVLEKKIIPKLFEGKGEQESVRVWVPGCATGEEAYSIAMLLCEHAATLDDPPGIQIFATDIDEDAIAFARDGIYPENIATDISPERLDRFFSQHREGYQVKKQIRERVLFAAHNLIKDPPFSKLDLISCRNLLIYFNREVQEKVFELFHYALLPERYMMLGSSESTLSGTRLFGMVNKQHRVYQKRRVATETLRSPRLPIFSKAQPTSHSAAEGTPSGDIPSAAYIHQRLLIEQYTPLSVVVDENHEIIHVSKSGSPYLHFAAGTPTNNILQAVHPGLRIELRTALFSSFRSERTTLTKRVQFEHNGEQRAVNLVVQPINVDPYGEGYAQVVFEEAAPLTTSMNDGAPAEDGNSDLVEQLEEELHRTTHRLQTTIEEYETSNEELKALNEELQSMNEEMQSTTEELETSKEELQSMNEELVTVNQELKTKIDELNRSNSDLQNLMSATEIATLFLDRDLRVKRFTPRLTEIFNILRTDIGRPLAHLTHTLDHPALADDARQVLDNLSMIEREVTSQNGKEYIARLRPYRTVDDKIDGVVLTFINITEQKRAAAKDHFQAYILNHINDSVIALDNDRHVRYINEAMATLVAVDPQAAIGKSISELYTFQWIRPEDEQAAYAALEETGTCKSEVILETQNGRSIYAELSVAELTDRNGEMTGRLAAIRDVTERRQAEQQRRQAEAQYRLLVEKIQEYAILLLDVDGHITTANPGAEAVMGYSEKDLVGQPFRIIFTPEDRAQGLPEQVLQEAAEQGSTDNEGWRLCKDGTRFWANGVLTALRNSKGTLTGFIKVLRDTTQRRKAEEALRESEETLRLAIEGAQQGIWSRDLTTNEMIFDEQAQRLFGMNPELSFEEAMQRVHPDDLEQVQQALQDALAPSSTGDYDVEHRLLLPDGTRWLAVSAQCYFEGTGAARTPKRLIGVAQDISARKQAEAALKESRERLDFALEAAEIGQWDINLETRTASRTLRHDQIFGYETLLPEWSYDIFLEHIIPDDRAEVDEKFNQALAEGTYWDFECRIRQANGALAWISAVGQVWQSVDGTPYRMLGTITDITERKEAEENLKQRARQQAAVADLGLFALGSTDVQALMDRAVRRVADTLEVAYCKVLELQADHKTLLLRAGVGWQEGLVGHATVGTGKDSQAGYTLRSDGPVIVDNLAEEARFSGPTLLREHGVVSGLSVIIQSNEYPYGVMGAHTRLHRPFSKQDAYFLQAIANIIGDAMGRQRAEDALLESKERFQAVAETVPDIIFTTDADINVEYLNQRWTTFTGLPVEKGLGDAWQDLLHPDDQDRVRALWEAAQESGDYYEDRQRLRSADGSYHWILVRAQPIYTHEGEVARWFGSATDINSLVEAEKEISELNETLEERVEERTRQVRSLASALTLAEQQERRRIAQILHDDLQQMLYGLDMSIQQLQRDTLSDQQKLFLEQAEAILNQAIDTTRSLTVDLSPPVLKGEGLAQAFEWLAVQMEKTHGLTVNIEAESSILIPSEDLRVLLFQLVRELLFNVVKHANVEQADLNVLLDDGEVRIIVTDKGEGFDPDTLDQRREDHAGGGFGLFSVRERLILFDGHLEVDSAPGRGTRMTLTAPVGDPISNAGKET